MLITRCAHCEARFRVTPQQLNARQGQVRCGRCQQVFNGFGALERFPDDDTGARLLADHEAALRGEPAPTGMDEAPPPLDDAPPFDATALEPSAAAESPLAPQPDPAPSMERPPIAAPAPPPASPAAFARGTRSGGYAAQELRLEAPARPPPSRAWRWAALLMALVVVVELAFAFRAQLARRYPPLRPVLEAVCQPLRCEVPWPRDESLIRLEDSDMLEVPGKPGEIALGARIRNLASAAQEYPHVELTLTDLTGQAAARRVLRPAEYLGRTPAPGEVLPAGAEVMLQLRLQTPRLKPTGYQLLLFYP